MTSNEIKLRRALKDLLEQVESLNGVEFTKDIEPYKAEANWNDAMENAHAVLKTTNPALEGTQ